MHSNHTVLPLRERSDSCDRYGRGLTGQYDLLWGYLIESPEDLSLHRNVFDSCFDNKITISKVLYPCGCRKSFENGFFLARQLQQNQGFLPELVNQAPCLNSADFNM